MLIHGVAVPVMVCREHMCEPDVAANTLELVDNGCRIGGVDDSGRLCRVVHDEVRVVIGLGI